MKNAGIALMSAVLLLGAIAVLVAALVFTALLDLRAAGNEANHEQALYVAEAGIAWLSNEAGRGIDFSDLLIRSSAGGPPFDKPQSFGPTPGGFRISLRTLPSPGVIAISEGIVRGGGRARVEAWLFRAPAFIPPSVATLGKDLQYIAYQGDIQVSAPGGVAAIGAETEEAGGLWKQARPDGPEVFFVGDTGLAPSTISLAQDPDRTIVGPVGSAVWGSTTTPEVIHMTTNGEITGEVEANGIMISDVPLRVSGVLRVEGMLLAMAGLEITGRVEVEGALRVDGHLTGSVASQLMILGSDNGFELAEQARPNVLPRQCVLGGWREL